MFFKKKKEVKRDIDLTKLPQHIGVIMDGNGRWATHRIGARQLYFARLEGQTWYSQGGTELLPEFN